jgi:hypothetical protein
MPTPNVDLYSLIYSRDVLAYLGVDVTKSADSLARTFVKREIRDLALAYAQGDCSVRSASKLLPMYSLVADCFDRNKVNAHISALSYLDRLRVSDELIRLELILERVRRVANVLSQDTIRE